MLGVNYGRVGFLASIPPADLERDLERVFAGEYVTVPLPTLQVRLDGERYIAVNDVVVTSSTLGKMIELAWAIGGEDLGVVPCDGMICSTPSGSTAYNLSNGGPVLVRGLDAMAVTFIAPHSLHARPFVVPRGAEVTVGNATVAVAAALLVDGQRVAEVAPGDEVGIYLCRGAEPPRDAARDVVLQPVPRDLLLLRAGRGRGTLPRAGEAHRVHLRHVHGCTWAMGV